MSKVQERGLREVLAEAEALARVLRAMSDGKMDLQPVLIQARTRPLEMSWGEAKTEALAIAGAHNHMTRDIKPPGQCPGCDRYWEARVPGDVGVVSDTASP